MTIKSKVLDFSGKNIYIGIDDHLTQWNVGIYMERSFHKVFQQDADAEQLRSYLDRNFPGGTYYSACEVGFKGFTTHRELEAVGISNIVVNPSDVPTQDRERKQKRDRVDAQKLGRHLRGQSLDGIYVPSPEIEQDRSLLRYRCDNVVPKITRIKNQIKSFIYRYGKKIPLAFKGKRWNKAFKKWLSEVKFEQSSARFVLDGLLEELAFYENKLLNINRQIVSLSKTSSYARGVELLGSIPGVGLLTAMIILTELVDLDRFKNLDKLCSYIGLIPNVYSSGDKEWVGGQTNRGQKLFRRLWIQSSWRARSIDPALGQCYEDLVDRMKPQKAIIRIAKKLLARMRRVWTSGEPYQMGIK